MLWHRLAARLGMSVQRAQEEIDAEEFHNWLAYFQIDTWDADGYLQTGILSALVANALGGKRHWRPADFMPNARRKNQSNLESATGALRMMFGHGN